MFMLISEYITKSKIERQDHIRLEEPCVEIGGYDSREFRGLLAHFLKTTIPTKQKICLCHACHNHACSNPRHLYWGTYKENIDDAIANGKKTIWEASIAKYGEEKARKLQKQRHKKRKPNVSQQEIEERKSIILSCDPKKWGWVSRASDKLKISHSSLRRFVDSHFPELEFKRR